MRQDLASGLARDRHDAVEKRRQVEIGHGRSIVHAAAAGPAARIADHTRSGVAGMSMSRTPSGARASSTALITRSEEHTSELQSLMRISYAVFCLKKKKKLKISNSQTTLN